MGGGVSEGTMVSSSCVSKLSSIAEPVIFLSVIMLINTPFTRSSWLDELAIC